MNGVRDLFSDLIDTGAFASASFIGCSDLENRSVEKNFGVILPFEYKQFLVIAGKSVKKLFQGTDIFSPRVLDLQSEPRELRACVLAKLFLRPLHLSQIQFRFLLPLRVLQETLLRVP